MKIRKNLKYIIVIILAVKLILGTLFVNAEHVKAFYDFVKTFNFTTSPWDIYFMKGDLSVFPYPPLMLYLYKIVLFPVELFKLQDTLFLNFFYIWPILLADFGIFWILNKMFPNKESKILFFYFISPVVIYASFILGHLDLVAVFFLLMGLLSLHKKLPLQAAILFGLGFSVKIPVIFALPLVVIYLYKKHQRDKVKILLQFTLGFIGTVLLISAPFLLQQSYWKMVILNPQQSLLYSIFVKIGQYKIYVAYLMLIFVYARFVMYEKINKDLFHNFLAVIYSVFVIMVPPSENWYIWSYVLLSILFISLFDKRKEAYVLSLSFSFFYLLLFVVMPSIQSENIINLIFTTFEGVLLFTVYILYKFGIKSNSIYKKKQHATIIGIGGDSGVGKSTLKRSLMHLIGESNIVPIESDGDHKWGRGDQSWDLMTHLNPKANYLYRQAQYLKELKNGSSIERVEYDHHTGEFSQPQKVYANDYILVAGLHPFYLPQTRRLVDIKIYVDTQEKLRRHWKIVRDITQRGYDIDKIMEQINSREEDAVKFIYPQKNYADLVVRFYSDDDYNEGKLGFEPHLNMELMLRLDIEIEGIVEAFEHLGFVIDHSYDSDMQFQRLILEKPIEINAIISVVESKIINYDEIVNGNLIKWEDGYHGFIQLIVLLIIGHHMRRGDDHEV